METLSEQLKPETAPGRHTKRTENPVRFPVQRPLYSPCNPHLLLDPLYPLFPRMARGRVSGLALTPIPNLTTPHPAKLTNTGTHHNFDYLLALGAGILSVHAPNTAGHCCWSGSASCRCRWMSFFPPTQGWILADSKRFERRRPLAMFAMAQFFLLNLLCGGAWGMRQAVAVAKAGSMLNLHGFVPASPLAEQKKVLLTLEPYIPIPQNQQPSPELLHCRGAIRGRILAKNFEAAPWLGLRVSD